MPYPFWTPNHPFASWFSLVLLIADRFLGDFLNRVLYGFILLGISVFGCFFGWFFGHFGPYYFRPFVGMICFSYFFLGLSLLSLVLFWQILGMVRGGEPGVLLRSLVKPQPQRVSASAGALAPVPGRTARENRINMRWLTTCDWITRRVKNSKTSKTIWPLNHSIDLAYLFLSWCPYCCLGDAHWRFVRFWHREVMLPCIAVDCCKGNSIDVNCGQSDEKETFCYFCWACWTNASQWYYYNLL